MSERTAVQGTVTVQCRAAWCRVDYLGVRWNDGEVQHTHTCKVGRSHRMPGGYVKTKIS